MVVQQQLYLWHITSAKQHCNLPEETYSQRILSWFMLAISPLFILFFFYHFVKPSSLFIINFLVPSPHLFFYSFHSHPAIISQHLVSRYILFLQHSNKTSSPKPLCKLLSCSSSPKPLFKFNMNKISKSQLLSFGNHTVRTRRGPWVS